MMSNHFLLPKTISKTIQPFPEFKKRKKIKSKKFPAKNPEKTGKTGYLVNGWTWNFKNHQKMIWPPPSLTTHPLRPKGLNIWEKTFENKSKFFAPNPFFRISSHISPNQNKKKTILKIRNILLYDVAPFFAS